MWQELTFFPICLHGVQAATDGKGVDMILENVANVNLDADLGLLTKFGRITVSCVNLVSGHVRML